MLLRFLIRWYFFFFLSFSRDRCVLEIVSKVFFVQNVFSVFIINRCFNDIINNISYFR